MVARFTKDNTSRMWCRGEELTDFPGSPVSPLDPGWPSTPWNRNKVFSGKKLIYLSWFNFMILLTFTKRCSLFWFCSTYSWLLIFRIESSCITLKVYYMPMFDFLSHLRISNQFTTLPQPHSVLLLWTWHVSTIWFDNCINKHQLQLNLVNYCSYFILLCEIGTFNPSLPRILPHLHLFHLFDCNSGTNLANCKNFPAS